MNREVRIKECLGELYQNEYCVVHVVQIKVLWFWITIKTFDENYKYLAKELYDMINEDIENETLPLKYYMK